MEQKVYEYQTYRHSLLGLSQDVSSHHYYSLIGKQKVHAKTLFVSATPAGYELQRSQAVIEQIIRPTGLLDPLVSVYPKSGDYAYLLESVEQLVQKKPYLTKFLDGYEESSSGEVMREGE